MTIVRLTSILLAVFLGCAFDFAEAFNWTVSDKNPGWIHIITPANYTSMMAGQKMNITWDYDSENIPPEAAVNMSIYWTIPHPFNKFNIGRFHVADIPSVSIGSKKASWVIPNDLHTHLSYYIKAWVLDGQGKKSGVEDTSEWFMIISDKFAKTSGVHPPNFKLDAQGWPHFEIGMNRYNPYGSSGNQLILDYGEYFVAITAIWLVFTFLI